MEKRWKILLVLAVASAGTAIAFVGAMPEGFKSVSDLVVDAHRYEGRMVELKATVVPASLDRTGDGFRFLVTDDATELLVVWTKPIPNHEAGGTIEGRTVQLKGTLTRDAQHGYVFHAEDMVVGCASKYEGEGDNGTPGNGTAAAAY